LLLALNPHRMKSVLYRAPHSDKWETKTLDWALDQIAQRVKAARDADFTARDPEGRTLNSVRNMGTLGGATLNIEDNYLIKKLFCGGLGVVSVENQART
jgi:formate dehydrogenase major subunit